MPQYSQRKKWIKLHAFLACCALVPLSCFANQQPAGLAAVTTATGSIQMRGESGKATQLKLHETVEISGCTINSTPQSNLVLSLSNGVGLAVDENTSLTVGTYTQAPFTERQQGLQFEPSVSKLLVQLDEGLIAIAFEHLSPLSSAEVGLPAGQLKVHSGITLVEVAADKTCTISVISGTATLNAKKNGKRVFLSANQSAVVSGETTSMVESSEIPADRLALGKAADYSRQRVLFKASDSDTGPIAVWVSKVEPLEKPSERPYSFDL